MKLLKKYGQNFLQNFAYAGKIVRALDSGPDDIILEIGAGAGILTKYIGDQAYRQAHIIEIDPRWSDGLKKNYGHLPGLEVIRQDFLDYDFRRHWGDPAKQVRVVGNIPYHITSPILFKLLENYRYISRVVLMVQKEVADRLTAGCGSKDYGITSVFLATKGHAKKLFDIGREHFRPVPKVDSSVILIDFDVVQGDILDEALFVKLVRGTFQTRRKKIRNSLERIIGDALTGKIESIDLNCRPEELSPAEFKELANEVSGLSN